MLLTRASTSISRGILRRGLCLAPQKLIVAEEMPRQLRRRIAALEGMHSEMEGLEEDLQARMAELEREYAGRTMNLYRRRQEIVAGEREPSDEEVNASVYFADVDADASTAAADDVAGVPAFWPTVLKQANSLRSIPGFGISEADWAVLDYLVELRSEPWSGDQDMMPEGWSIEGSEPGFALHFIFAPNAMLETTQLTLYCSGDCEVLRASAPIWADERHDPTQKMVTKKSKKKGGEVTKRAVSKPVESFFRIFAEPDAFDADDDRMPWMKNFASILEGDQNASAASGEPMQLSLLQGELALRLREDVIPRASLHYISALQGIEDDGDWSDPDGDDDDWEMEEEPRRTR
jgi:nucleosome assembly protein 1-like 1